MEKREGVDDLFLTANALSRVYLSRAENSIVNLESSRKAIGVDFRINYMDDNSRAYDETCIFLFAYAQKVFARE